MNADSTERDAPTAPLGAENVAGSDTNQMRGPEGREELDEHVIELRPPDVDPSDVEERSAEGRS